MRKNGLLILTGLTLAVVAAASAAVMMRSPSEATAGTKVLLFEDLPANDVTTLQVVDADGSLTVDKVDEAWTLVERGGYPVDVDKVKQAVLGLSQLLIEEPKTSLPENFSKLGVAEPGTADSTATKVTLKDASGTIVAAAILGESKFRRGSQALYVRREGENQVYLCEGRLQIDARPTSWIERDLLRLEGDRVASVRVAHPDGEEVLIGRDPDNAEQFLVENIPPGREQKFAGVANSLGTALNYLSLEDVAPAAEVDFSAEPLAQTTFRCKDGLVLQAQTARFEEGTWLRLGASYEEPPEAIGPSPDEPAAEVADEAASDAEDEQVPIVEAEAAEEAEAEAEEDTPDPAAVQAEADAFNELWSRWAYKIQDYKGEVLARHLEALLLELPAEEPVPVPVPEDGAVDLDGSQDAAGGE